MQSPDPENKSSTYVYKPNQSATTSAVENKGDGPAPTSKKAGTIAPSYKKNTGKGGNGKKPGGNPKKQSIIISCIILVLVIVVLIVSLLPGCLQKSPSSSLTSSTLTEASTSISLAAESGYDKDKHTLATDEYANTILPETTDAGEEYINETLFLGDSNTARMLEYSADTKVSLNTSIGVIGMGIQGASSSSVVKFNGVKGSYTMTQAVAILKPRRVVITFGTNNAGGMKTESFITNYNNVLDALEESYPYADIIIGAVPPIAQSHMNQSLSMTAIDEYNQALVELAKERNLKFLNWTEDLKDHGTGFIKSGYAVGDGVHLSKDGMKSMITYFRTHSYISEDSRPKPLGNIPKRLAIPPPVVSSTAPKSTAPVAETSSSSSKSQATPEELEAERVASSLAAAAATAEAERIAAEQAAAASKAEADRIAAEQAAADQAAAAAKAESDRIAAEQAAAAQAEADRLAAEQAAAAAATP